MADRSDGKVVIEITGDASELIKSLQEATTAARDGLSGAMKDVAVSVREAAAASDNVQDSLKDTANSAGKAEDGLKDTAKAADKAEDELKDAAKASDDLGDELKDTAKAADKAEDELKKTGKAAKEVGKALKDAGKKALSFRDVLKANVFGNIITGALQAVKNSLIDIGKSLITNAADFRALNAQYEQTFGELGDQADAAVRRVADSCGIVESRLKGSAASVYAFARSSGASTDEAMSLMETSLKAAADAAAYYDVSLEDATDTLQSFLKGNFANDAALGVSCTETTRNAAAMELFGKKYSELSEIQKQQTLLKMVTDAQELSGAMGQASREMEGWENVTGNLRATWNEFLANVGTPLLDALVPVLQDVTARLSEMMENVDWDKFAEDVGSALSVMIDGLGWIIEHGGEVTLAIEGIATAVNPLVGGLAIIATAVASFQQACDNGVDSLSTWQTFLLDVFQPGWQGLAQGMNDAQHEAELATNLTGRNLRELEGIMENTAVGWHKSTFDMTIASTEMTKATGTALSDAASAVRGAFVNAKEQIVTAARDAATSVQTAFSNAKEEVQNAWSRATEFFTGVWEDIKGAFSDAWSDFHEIGMQILRGLAQGILDGIRGAVAAAKRVVTAIKNVFTSRQGLDIHSPSHLAEDYGKAIDAGLALGIWEDRDKAVEAVEGLISAVNHALQKGLQAIVDDYESAAKDLQEQQEALAERLGAQGDLFTQTVTGSSLGQYGGMDALLEDLDFYDAWEEAFRELRERGVPDSFLADWLETDAKTAVEYAQKLLQLPPGQFDEYLELFEQRKEAAAEMAGAIENEQARFTTLADLQGDIDQINAYGDALRQLRERGAPEELFAEIRDMDQDAAIEYARALLALSDEAWDEYMATYAAKAETARRVAEEVFGPEVQALEDEFMATLPDKLEGVGADAMDALAGAILGEGQLAIDATAFVADAILAEMERINFMDRLQTAANDTIIGLSQDLASGANSSKEAADAASQAAAARQAAAYGVVSAGNNGGTEFVVKLDGVECARGMLPHTRAADEQSPKVVSD